MSEWNPNDGGNKRLEGNEIVKNIPILDEDETSVLNEEEYVENLSNPLETKVKEPAKSKIGRVIIIVLIASIVGGFSIGAGSAFVNKYFDGFKYDNNFYLESSTQPLISEEVLGKMEGNNLIVSIAEQVGPSVVAITSKVTVEDIFSSYESLGAGSGVVFNINDDSVVILTNNHVIDGAKEVTVEFDEYSSSKATLVGVDPETDLAVIKVAIEEVPKEVMEVLKPAVFGDSDTLRVGETAIAIGNPLGYNRTVTVGVVSALNRELQVSETNFTLIQTDAAINPGNSGGALVNSRGEIVGINTVKIADTQVEGIGFAIPINSAKPIVNQLLEKGYVTRPYFGVAGRDIDEKLSELYELPIGVYVVNVIPGSAADQAGIQRGDVIISFDSEIVMNMEQLIALIKDKSVGDEIEVKIIRNGKEKIVTTVKLKEKRETLQ